MVLRLKSSDIEADYRAIEEGLDTSNFPLGHPLRDIDKASELGFFKSEVGRDEISVFAAIRWEIILENLTECGAAASNAPFYVRQSNYLHTSRPKCYTMTVEKVDKDGKRVQKLDNKLKGVDRSVVRQMTLETYLRTLLLNETQTAKSVKISSKSHSIFMESIKKQALSNLDDKVRILIHINIILMFHKYF